MIAMSINLPGFIYQLTALENENTSKSKSFLVFLHSNLDWGKN